MPLDRPPKYLRDSTTFHSLKEVELDVRMCQHSNVISTMQMTFNDISAMLQYVTGDL